MSSSAGLSMAPPPLTSARAVSRPSGTVNVKGSTATAATSSSTSSTTIEIQLPSDPFSPAFLLGTETAVAQWPTTPGYQAFVAWLKRRAQRIRGRPIVTGPYADAPKPIIVLMHILDALYSWISEVPPQPQDAQRFGNLAFRDYIKLVEHRLPGLLDDETQSLGTPLPSHLRRQMMALLLASHAFGHPTRLDYGTGHELAFVLALFCSVVSGWVESEDAQDQLILRVFPRYLDLTTALQQTYRLEPAGSHGVWGLDDYVFLPYFFGSAQLLGGDISPAESLRLATASSTANSARASTSAPPPTLSPGTTPANQASSQPLPQPTISAFTDMYTLSLHRISLFKRGARFSEHSPLLHSLSTFPSWVKVHGGLLKMFEAEVLGKRVVVQGLKIGGWLWGPERPVYAKEEDEESEDEEGESGRQEEAPHKVEEKGVKGHPDGPTISTSSHHKHKHDHHKHDHHTHTKPEGTGMEQTRVPWATGRVGAGSGVIPARAGAQTGGFVGTSAPWASRQ